MSFSCVGGLINRNNILVQILSMIEEAAGTRLYQSKRESAEKMIEKKESKVREIDSVS